MFNVTISFDQPENKREEFVNRIQTARKQILDNFVKNEVIQDFEETENQIKFRVSYGGTQEFLSKLPNLIWHFRVLDKRAEIMLQAVPAV